MELVDQLRQQVEAACCNLIDQDGSGGSGGSDYSAIFARSDKYFSNQASNDERTTVALQVLLYGDSHNIKERLTDISDNLAGQAGMTASDTVASGYINRVLSLTDEQLSQYIQNIQNMRDLPGNYPAQFTTAFLWSDILSTIPDSQDRQHFMRYCKQAVGSVRAINQRANVATQQHRNNKSDQQNQPLLWTTSGQARVWNGYRERQINFQDFMHYMQQIANNPSTNHSGSQEELDQDGESLAQHISRDDEEDSSFKLNFLNPVNQVDQRPIDFNFNQDAKSVGSRSSSSTQSTDSKKEHPTTFNFRQQGRSPTPDSSSESPKEPPLSPRGMGSGEGSTFMLRIRQPEEGSTFRLRRRQPGKKASNSPSDDNPNPPFNYPDDNSYYSGMDDSAPRNNQDTQSDHLGDGRNNPPSKGDKSKGSNPPPRQRRDSGVSYDSASSHGSGASFDGSDIHKDPSKDSVPGTPGNGIDDKNSVHSGISGSASRSASSPGSGASFDGYKSPKDPGNNEVGSIIYNRTPVSPDGGDRTKEEENPLTWEDGSSIRPPKECWFTVFNGCRLYDESFESKQDLQTVLEQTLGEGAEDSYGLLYDESDNQLGFLDKEQAKQALEDLRNGNSSTQLSLSPSYSDKHPYQTINEKEYGVAQSPNVTFHNDQKRFEAKQYDWETLSRIITLGRVTGEKEIRMTDFSQDKAGQTVQLPESIKDELSKKSVSNKDLRYLRPPLASYILAKSVDLNPIALNEHKTGYVQDEEDNNNCLQRIWETYYSTGPTDKDMPEDFKNLAKQLTTVMTEQIHTANDHKASLDPNARKAPRPV